eukprot:UN11691
MFGLRKTDNGAAGFGRTLGHGELHTTLLTASYCKAKERVVVYDATTEN